MVRRSRTRRASIRRAVLAGGTAFLLGGVISAMLASNVVASSRAGAFSSAIDAEAVKPTECAAITLSAITTGTGTFNATNGNDLVLGSTAVDSIGGRNGDDCILGGDGNDTINGGTGNDVCIGGAGNDTFSACETQIQ